MGQADWLRLQWRMHRWEGTFVIGGAVLLSAAMAIVAWQLDASRDLVVACYEQPTQTLSAECRSAIEWGNTLAGAIGILGAVATVTPFAAGIVLGAPLLSREIEHRTAPMAWTLSPSRRSWLAWRTVPLLIVLIVALLVLGQASAFLLKTAEEGELGFRHYGMFGPMLAARGLAVFGIGLVVGLALGRVLPAVLMTALASVLLVAGLSIGRDLMMRDEAVWRPMGDGSEVVSMVFDSGFESDETGEVITWEQAFNEYPEVFTEFGEGAPPGMSPVWKIVPPEQFDVYEAREIGALALTAVLLGALALLLVGRRRPE
jgi:hypothetical protein